MLFSVVTAFSNFQATFPLISSKVFGKFTPNYTTKVRKIWQNLWYQNHSGCEKNFGGWCCVSCQARLANKIYQFYNKSMDYDNSEVEANCYVRTLLVKNFWVHVSTDVSCSSTWLDRVTLNLFVCLFTRSLRAETRHLGSDGTRLQQNAHKHDK